MNLPKPGPQYDQPNEAAARKAIMDADARTQKIDQDFVVKNNKLILVSPNGTRYSGTISNSGTLTWTAL